MKRGLQHIEAILAFLLFIGFLLAALFFFNPLDTRRVVDSSLFYTFDEIKEEASITLESYSILIKSEIPQTVSIIIQTGFNSSIVEDISGNKVPAVYDEVTHQLTFDRLSIENTFFMVKFSNEFPEENVNNLNDPLNPNNYTISSSGSRELISENKILELNSSYYNDYEGLKKQFNLPGRVGFGFTLVFSRDDEIVSEINIPGGIEVFSESERIDVLRKDGTLSKADLIVRVW